MLFSNACLSQVEPQGFRGVWRLNGEPRIMRKLIPRASQLEGKGLGF